MYLWGLLCSGHAVDRDTNNLSVFNTIEELQATVLTPVPAAEAGGGLPVPFELVTLWRRSNAMVGESSRCRFQVTFEEAPEIVRYTQSIEVDLMAFERARVVAAVGGVPLPNFEPAMWNVWFTPQQDHDGTWANVGIPIPLKLTVNAQDAPPPTDG